ncbi:MAG TPA: DUF938 domain-containing protein [Polyangia bacterium]|jgi:hypothetical protein|nr:DUF938 domain-containing protein [Polyangia bacterium]
MKEIWPAAERNKQPILEVLRRVLPAEGTVLEVASGTGQHAAFFASQLPALSWQPSDIDDQNLVSIRAWVDEARRSNLRPPCKLDVTQPDWGVGTVEAIFNANMIHIAPWACCVGLVAGVGRHLAPSGVLVMYGPFRVGGAHTAVSNAEFDLSLKSRDPQWGVRDCEAVTALAEEAGLKLQERVPMPANNQILVFTR